MEWVKLVGVIALGMGIFFIFKFPDFTQHQPKGFTTTGLLIGLALAGIGIRLLM